jgi:hypothetical protein
MVLGDKHPDTLMLMVHLGATYSKLGRSIEAEELGKQAMENMERLLGTDHPNTLRAMNYLTVIYRDQ